MNYTTPLHALDRFKHHLNEIIAAEQLYFLFDTTQDDFQPDLPLNLLQAGNINPADFVASVSWECIQARLAAYPNVGQPGGRCLQVAPCSPLFASSLERLATIYTSINFVDNSRAGLMIGDHKIKHPDEIQPGADDLCLLLTRNTDACDSYERMFGRANCLNLLRDYLLKTNQELAAATPPFLARLNGSNKPILFASARPMATLNSTIGQLRRDGYDTFWLGNEEIKDANQTGYATPKVVDMPLDGYSIGALVDFIHIFANMEQGLALYHYETIYMPSWDFKRIALCYAATLALIRTIKELRLPGSRARLGLYMYDAIKPAVKNYDAGGACGRLYKAMMAEAEAVVFSSFTDDFGDFVENSVGKKLPRVHHHRYQSIPTKRQPRLKGAYHIAILTSVLGDVWQPSTEGLRPYIYQVLQQGIHVHYYAGDSRGFRESLPPQLQQLFHLHTPIHNLEALANEISQYHAGWTLINMQVFDKMVTHIKDPFLRDAMDLFTPTTLPSVIWSCSAAGLPMIYNRSMVGIDKLLPLGLCIPTTLSEVGSLRQILDRQDWAAIDCINLEVLDISHHIYKLHRFLDGYYPKKAGL